MLIKPDLRLIGVYPSLEKKSQHHLDLNVNHLLRFFLPKTPSYVGVGGSVLFPKKHHGTCRGPMRVPPQRSMTFPRCPSLADAFELRPQHPRRRRRPARAAPDHMVSTQDTNPSSACITGRDCCQEPTFPLFCFFHHFSPFASSASPRYSIT